METNINTEFSRYLLVKRLESQLVKKDTKISVREKYLNILERWLLTLSEDWQSEDSDAIFSSRKIDDSYPPNQKMIADTKDKNLDFNFTKFIQEVAKWINRKTTEQCPQPILQDNILIIPGYLLHPFPKNRLPAILASINTSPDLKPTVLATTFLRYECILQRGNHWTNSIELYSTLVNDYGFEIEGFCSPFNSQIIQLQQQLNFCSLFKDTDGIFGSLGSFFTVPSFLGKSVTVCPPYTEQILDDILKVIIRDCTAAVQENKRVRFFFGLPDWDDTNLIKFLDTYEHTKFKIGKMPIYFTDNRIDSVVLNSFGNYYHMVSVNYPEDNYDKIHQVFSDMLETNRQYSLLSNSLSAIVNDNIDVVSEFLTDQWIINKFIAEKLFFWRKLGKFYRLFQPHPDYIKYHILADILVYAHTHKKSISHLLSNNFQQFASKYIIP